MGRKVTDEEMKRFKVDRNKFHDEWNYVIRPDNSTIGMICLFTYGA